MLCKVRHFHCSHFHPKLSLEDCHHITQANIYSLATVVVIRSDSTHSHEKYYEIRTRGNVIFIITLQAHPLRRCLVPSTNMYWIRHCPSLKLVMHRVRCIWELQISSLLIFHIHTVSVIMRGLEKVGGQTVCLPKSLPLRIYAETGIASKVALAVFQFTSSVEYKSLLSMLEPNIHQSHPICNWIYEAASENKF